MGRQARDEGASRRGQDSRQIQSVRHLDKPSVSSGSLATLVARRVSVVIARDQLFGRPPLVLESGHERHDAVRRTTKREVRAAMTVRGGVESALAFEESKVVALRSGLLCTLGLPPLLSGKDGTAQRAGWMHETRRLASRDNSRRERYIDRRDGSRTLCRCEAPARSAATEREAQGAGDWAGGLTCC